METCPIKTFLDSKKEYYIEQINTGCLSQFSYYIESNGEALIIDPMRDFDKILELLQTRNSKLKYIFETHFHADFVSGHIDLATKTNADILFGPNANPNYKIKNLKNHEKINLGWINFQLLHTPGHTLESSCLILIDQNNKKKVIFTGDTLFLGDVGRPDLAVKSNLSKENLAEFLYNSIQEIKKLPEEIIIFPGHGSGSACGKNISAGSGDILKNQLKNNYALDEKLKKEDFIKIVSTNLPEPPKYFFHDVKKNMDGYKNLEILLEKNLKSLKLKEFDELLTDEDVIAIDTRDEEESANCFIRGTHLVPLKINYASWSGILFDPEKKIILITEKNKEKESIIRLIRVGFENIIGYLEGGIDSYLNDPIKKNKIVKFEKVDYEKGKKLIDIGDIEVIDVRENGEFENTGVINNSRLYPLSELQNKIDEMRGYHKKLGLVCKSGARANIAGSILKKNNINDFIVLGGFTGLAEKGVKVVKFFKK